MSVRLPPHLSVESFNAAIEEFRAALGVDWVFVDDDDVSLYRDAYSPRLGESGEKYASAAVAPQSVEEVQAVVRTANKYKIPLYPISTGRNLGYGGSAPVLSGSVVVDLKRMNRILEVNEQQAYALVEPGVSYFDLYRHLQEHDIALWVDFPAPAWGSPVGNALDRGMGGARVEHSDHWNQHCGLEVVTPTGEVMRTGMGALPGSKTWQTFRWGFGPTLDGLFCQSNFGIVTKMGFRMTRRPEAQLDATVILPRFSDLHEAARITLELIGLDVLRCGCAFASPALAPVVKADFPDDSPYWKLMQQDTQPTDAQMDEYVLFTGKPCWMVMLSFVGVAEVIQAQWAYAAKRYSVIAGASIPPPKLVTFPIPEELQAKMPMAPGVPSLSAFSAGTRASRGYDTPTTGHIWFSPLVPFDGAEIAKAHWVFNHILWKNKVRVFDPFLPNVDSSVCTMIFGFRFTEDHAWNARVRETYAEMVRVGAEHGWGLYRTHTMFMDEAVGTFSFDDHAQLRFTEKLKDAIDPNGIISAGRYGIWPGYLREKQ